MITAEIIGDKQVIAKLNNFAPRMREQILFSTRRLEFMMVAKVKQKLSGEVLKNRTNHLRGSIHGEVKDSGNLIEGVTGTNVVYARIHEEGGKTAPHEIRPKNTLALHFMLGGREVFAKVVHHPGSKIPQRSFLASSLREMRPTIIEEYEKATAEVIKNG